VGEARAALAFIAALRQLAPRCQIVLTAMTARGRDVAQRHFPDMPCFLAPLDVPWIVRLALKNLTPDLYITVESELWPVTLDALRRRNCPAILINGRMTAKAADSWRRFSWLFREIAASLRLAAVIGEEDRRRFASLGVAAGRLLVAGNLKYDHCLSDEDRDKLRRLRDLCAFGDADEVLLAGSTHAGEEEILLDVWRRLSREKPLALILVPRHIDRLPDLRHRLRQAGAPHQLFSELSSKLAAGGKHRQPVILVDSYGDLPVLYGLADYVFCGGSLTRYGGHNPLEAAMWEKAVCHGPDVKDFAAIYRQLDEAVAAFPVENGDELCAKIASFRTNPDAYRLACRRAGEIAAAQSGAAARQAALALQLLAETGHSGDSHARR
jgi:3-deoxy-D-manno-octulosonic-acid transferase